jgi:hypothetical protein
MWLRNESGFEDRLKELLGEGASFKYFEWSGRNTYTDRLKARDDLRDDLMKTAADNPSAKHFVIAHSHGGNAALYAMKDGELATKISGMVAMSTPFLNVKLRRAELRVLQLTLAAFLLASLPFWFLTTLALELYQTSFTWISSFSGLGKLMALALAGVLVWRFTEGIFKGFFQLTGWLGETWNGFATKRANWLIKNFATDNVTVPLLTVSFKFDEAALYLRLLHLITEPHALIFYGATIVLSVALTTQFTLLVTGIVIEPLLNLIDDIFLVSIESYFIVKAYAFIVFHIAVLFFALFAVVGFIAHRLVKGHFLGFGSDGLMDYLWVKTQIVALPIIVGPVSSSRYSLEEMFRNLGWKHTVGIWIKAKFLHSLIYQYDRAIQDIADWITTVTVQGTEKNSSEGRQ